MQSRSLIRLNSWQCSRAYIQFSVQNFFWGGDDTHVHNFLQRVLRFTYAYAFDMFETFLYLRTIALQLDWTRVSDRSILYLKLPKNGKNFCRGKFSFCPVENALLPWTWLCPQNMPSRFQSSRSTDPFLCKVCPVAGCLESLAVALGFVVWIIAKAIELPGDKQKWGEVHRCSLMQQHLQNDRFLLFAFDSPDIWNHWFQMGGGGGGGNECVFCFVSSPYIISPHRLFHHASVCVHSPVCSHNSHH